jgi:aspartate/methionine/tyrosine aminotransferase
MGRPETDTALRHDDEAIVINSFSKFYCMTGWRIGWMVVPEQAGADGSNGWRRICSSVPRALSQHAAIAALRCAPRTSKPIKAIYEENRRILLERLPAHGASTGLYPADGAFLHLRRCRRVHQ